MNQIAWLWNQYCPEKMRTNFTKHFKKTQFIIPSYCNQQPDVKFVNKTENFETKI